MIVSNQYQYYNKNKYVEYFLVDMPDFDVKSSYLLIEGLEPLLYVCLCLCWW